MKSDFAMFGVNRVQGGITPGARAMKETLERTYLTAK